jgi:hypothetical protein
VESDVESDMASYVASDVASKVDLGLIQCKLRLSSLGMELFL